MAFRLFIACLTFFVISPLYSEEGLSYAHGPAVQASFDVTKDARYSAKIQPGTSFSYTFSLASAGHLGIDAGMGFDLIGSSAVAEGVLYKGFTDVFLFIGARYPVFLRENYAAGISLQIFGKYGIYRNTDSYFFFPSLAVTPYSAFKAPFHDRVDLFVLLPSEIKFRRDTQISLSFGCSLLFQYFPLRYRT